MGETDWSGVRKRVEALARADWSRSIFGAWPAYGGDGHQFRLAKPLAEAEIREAEAQWTVALPEEYRSFLLQVGAGGAGPGYGLSTLSRGDTGWLWNAVGGMRHDLLRLPFPSAEFSARRDAEHAEREPAESAYEDEAAFLEAHRAWRERDDELFDRATAGAINLSHEGCGYCYWLVVSGPEHGGMWLDERPGGGTLDSLGMPSGQVTFADWYIDWLERSEAASHTS